MRNNRGVLYQNYSYLPRKKSVFAGFFLFISVFPPEGLIFSLFAGANAYHVIKIQPSQILLIM